MSKEDAHHFFQVISRRYERESIIVISNQLFLQWNRILANDKVVTIAILDRLPYYPLLSLIIPYWIFNPCTLVRL